MVRLATTGLLLLALGCSVVVDSGDDVALDLDVSLTNMEAFASRRAEVHLVDGDGAIQFRGVVDGLPAQLDSFFVGVMRPDATYRAQLFIDLDDDQVIQVTDGFGETVIASTAGAVAFSGESAFPEPDLAAGLGTDFVLQVMGFSPHLGQAVRVLVFDESTALAVGYLHIDVLPTEDYTAVVPGIIVAGHTYVIAMFADVNFNSELDPADHAWIQRCPSMGESDGAGTCAAPAAGESLTLLYPHNTNFDVDGAGQYF